VKPPRKVEGKQGYVWEVRYREGGRHRSRTFDRKADAEDFQAEVRRRKRLGTISHLHVGEELLADFAVEWWRIHARPNLELSTLRRYSQVWDKHVLPRLGMYRLQEVTPEVVADFRAELSERGVGDATVRKALFILQGVMALAVLHGRVAENPVKAVRKPRQASRTVRPLAPESVERIRLHLRVRDATLVSILPYAGLRPGEALALAWGNVRDRTILVDRAIALGTENGTKTNATRTVRLLAPLAEDLALWRRASTATELVFPRRDLAPLDRPRLPQLAKADLPASCPRRRLGCRSPLRPTPLVRVPVDPRGRVNRRSRPPGGSLARGVPCARTRTPSRNFDPSERVPAATTIARAREQLLGSNVRVLYARPPEAITEERRNRSRKPSRRRDSNPRPPLYESGALAN
jgi:integrase